MTIISTHNYSNGDIFYRVKADNGLEIPLILDRNWRGRSVIGGRTYSNHVTRHSSSAMVLNMVSAVLKSKKLTGEARLKRPITILKGFHQPELKTSNEMEVYHASLKSARTGIAHAYVPLSPQGTAWKSPIITRKDRGGRALFSPDKKPVGDLKRKLEEAQSDALAKKANLSK